MVKKCMYCGIGVDDSCVIDFCERCGVGVFGRKMFDTIVQNMEKARANGDLTHHRSDSSQDATNLKGFK